MQFVYESEVFQNSPKSCQSFGLLLLEILLPRTSQNSHNLVTLVTTINFPYSGSSKLAGNCADLLTTDGDEVPLTMSNSKL